MAKRLKRLMTDLEIIERLWDKTEFRNGCWIYKGTKIRGGYGSLGLGMRGNSELVHRLSAKIFLGLDLSKNDLQVNHKLECSNRLCWSPDHIYIGTQADNMRDVAATGIRQQEFCKSGHPMFGSNLLISRGKRYCRECIKLGMRESRKRRGEKKNA